MAKGLFHLEMGAPIKFSTRKLQAATGAGHIKSFQKSYSKDFKFEKDLGDHAPRIIKNYCMSPKAFVL